MQSVKITVKDHVGREVNPYEQFTNDDFPFKEINQKWKQFEATVQLYRCPELANTKPGEVVEAELVWRHANSYGGYTYTEQMTGYVTEEQIYRLVPKEEKSDYTTITEDEVKNWCAGSFQYYTLERLTELLNGQYSLEDARDDILSFRTPPTLK
jgi:hypothetical protein